MKKSIGIVLGLLAAISLFAGCSSKSSSTANTDEEITVISREDGSGTRGAFVELLQIEEKDSTGVKVDHTVDTADITNSTSVMMTSVAQNKNAIGYISLGSLNDTVKALEVDGAKATAEDILNGTYKIARPFNIVTSSNVTPVAQDFIDFILSSDGQDVVSKNHYIPLSDVAPYEGSKESGKIVIAGSSSVTPVMEKLVEAYAQINPNATIELQQSDSTTGVNSVIDGICDIGMASREIKDSEKEKGVVGTVIATDGIAIIVNNDNPLSGLTSSEIKDIYTGKTPSWNELA